MTFREWLKDARTSREKYVWRAGVIAWGIPWGVMTGIVVAINHSFFTEDTANHPAFDKLLASGAIITLFTLIGPFAGYGFGVWTWPRVAEEERQKAAEREANDRSTE